MDSVTERFMAKVNQTDGCWEWTGAKRENGYGRLGLSRPRRTVSAHRFAYDRFVGPIPDGLQVCHRCDNPGCVRPDHLFVGTAADNQADMVAKWRSLYGERHPSARLTEAQVLEIRRLAGTGSLRQREIGEMFGIDKRQVSEIVRGRKWRHLLPADWVAPLPNRWCQGV